MSGCERCRALQADLKFAQTCIVELQHLIRELRHEIANLKSPLVEQAKAQNVA